jgi:hypothetical protein
MGLDGNRGDTTLAVPGFTNPMANVGDIIVGGVAGSAEALPAGANTQVLAIVDDVPTWQADQADSKIGKAIANGSIIIGVNNLASELPPGNVADVLTVDANSAPTWAAPATPSVGEFSVTESSLTGDYTINSATYANTGLSVTFTTATNERVKLNFSGVIYAPSGSSNIEISYKIDAGADIGLGYFSIASTYANTIESVRMLPALASGSHTLLVRAKYSGASNVLLQGTSGNFAALVQITQIA